MKKCSFFDETLRISDEKMRFVNEDSIKTICIRKNRIVSRTRLEPKHYSYKKSEKETQESATFQLKKISAN